MYTVYQQQTVIQRIAVNGKFSHTQTFRMYASLLSSEQVPADSLKPIAYRATNEQYIVGIELVNHLRAVNTGLVELGITHQVERAAHGKFNCLLPFQA